MSKELVLTERQKKLLEFVKLMHGEQVRKYTNEPYWTHPLSVAKLVHQYASEYLAVEVALCHDLLEDTPCADFALFTKLGELEYSIFEAYTITKAVLELTDVYTSERFICMNRKTRKANEAIRLGGVSHIAHNVKFADLIDNTSSIVKHDKGFAKVYLQEKEEILRQMQGGDVWIRQKCLMSLGDAKAELLA
jgi:(p)ppGpp synthase/HD superfamily hydrolase